MNIHSLRFHNNLNVTPLQEGAGDKWQLNTWYAVTFCIDDDPARKLVFVPACYVTDFGSIPRFAWSIVGSPAAGLHRRGTIFHDWVFTLHSRDFEFANALFDAIVRYDGLSAWKRWLIIGAVKTAGYLAWKHWQDSAMAHHYCMIRDEQLALIDELNGMELYA